MSFDTLGNIVGDSKLSHMQASRVLIGSIDPLFDGDVDVCLPNMRKSKRGQKSGNKRNAATKGDI